MYLKTAVPFSHDLLKNVIVPGDTVVDATVGNGSDTVFLATLVEKKGHVYGFDIQEEAIKQTQEKLLLTGLTEQVTLVHAGHETFNQHVPETKEISAAIFNLGYLPKSDKSVITKPDTTLSAITQMLERLRKSGLLIIVVYYGHVGGVVEKDAVLAFCQNLDQTQYNVLQYGFINQKNSPPFVLAIEKK